MVEPVSWVANECRVEIKRDHKVLQDCEKETQKLIDAVFYKRNSQKNIFATVRDQVTELQAQKTQHEKHTRAKLELFRNQIEDMKRSISTY